MIGKSASDETPFRAPWEAQAFGLALKLHAAGVFTWSEWTETLATVIREAQAAGDPDLGDTYYAHWVGALERLVVKHRIADRGLLARLADQIAEEAHHAREAQLR